MERETRTITLPVCKSLAVLREGDGYAEREILKRNLKRFEALPEYLAFHVVSIGEKTEVTTKDILDLDVPDQEFIAIELYRLHYGDNFDFEYVCGCDVTRSSEQVVDLKELEFIPFTESTTEITLPRSGKRAVIGLLTGHQEQLILGQTATTGLDLNQSDFQCLRSLNSSAPTYEEVIQLPPADHKAIRKARKKLVCGYNTNIFAECPHCKGKGRINILMHEGFLVYAG